MADKEHMNTSKPEQGIRVQRDQQPDQKQPVVGRDVPDESKERHTEIAVEAGRTLGHAHKAENDKGQKQ